MTETETEGLARSGMIAGLCPTTEANLGDGIFPADRFLTAKGAIAIGSDSHISVSPAEDLRQLEYSQRLRDRARNVLAGGPGQSTGRRLFDAALQRRRQGDGATGRCHRAGPSRRYLRARCRPPSPDRPHAAMPFIDSWIFSGGNPCVKDMFVAGQHVVTDRRHMHEDEIAKAYRKAVEKLQ